jgi:hypothetical protein
MVEFPGTDVAAMACGHGCAAVTVRRVDGLQAVPHRMDDPRRQPLVTGARTTQHAMGTTAHSFACATADPTPDDEGPD